MPHRRTGLVTVLGDFEDFEVFIPKRERKKRGRERESPFELGVFITDYCAQLQRPSSRSVRVDDIKTVVLFTFCCSGPDPTVDEVPCRRNEEEPLGLPHASRSVSIESG